MSKQRVDYTKEFEPLYELSGNSKKYFRIPDEVLLTTEVGKYRVALYCYLYMHKGLNDIVNFSVPLFLEWAGFKSDTHENGLNDKVLETLYYLSDAGYVHFISKNSLTRTSCVTLRFDSDLVDERCNSGERFAIVYLDEVERIISYERTNKKDAHLNCFSILLVFVYLRRSIQRRINTVKIEEQSEERIADRQRRLPEAYNAKVIDIAEELNLHERTVSKSIEVLQTVQLIVVGTAYRVMTVDGEYRTPDFIFANFDKRDRGNMLAHGMEYAQKEIELKADEMYAYHIKYGVKYLLKNIA